MSEKIPGPPEPGGGPGPLTREERERAVRDANPDADHRGKKGKKKGGNQQGPKDGPGRRGKKGK